MSELVLRAKAGDLRSFEVLTSRYEGRVYSLALRILRHEQDAEDVTQQAFLSAMEYLSGISRGVQFCHLAPPHNQQRGTQSDSETERVGHRLPGGSY